MNRESKIQTDIMNYLKSLGMYVVKTMVTNSRGTPDILACHEGTFIGIEVKTSTGTPTDLQVYTIDKINEAKGVAGICRSVEDAEALLVRHHLI